MPQDDVLIDVDIPGLAPTLDTTVHTGIDAPKPGVNGSGIGKPDDDIAAAVDAIKRERDVALARAAAAETAKSSTAAELDAERAARVAAEKAAGTSNERTLRAEWNAANTQHEQYAQGVLQMKDLIKSNEAQLAQVFADENLTLEERGKRAASIQTKISLAANDLRTLEMGEAGSAREIEGLKHKIKSERAKALEQPKPERQQQTQQQVPTADQWIGQFPSKTQDWLKAHRDYVDNQTLNKKLIAFAEDYHDGGAKALHDDDFIAALDKRFGFAKEKPVSDERVIEIETAAPKIQRPTATAAPVSRNSGPSSQPSNGSATGRVRLTPDEQNTAVAMFPDLDANEAMRRYGRNKAEAIRDGKYNT